MNATASTDKGSTFQRMERHHHTRTDVRVVGAPDGARPSGEPTETFHFKLRVHAYTVGSQHGANVSLVQAQVRTSRKRRRYIRTSRATRRQIRHAAHVYNESRKAGLTYEEAISVLRTQGDSTSSTETVDSSPGRRAPRTFATCAAGLVLCAFLGADRSTTPAVAVVTALAFLAAAIARTFSFTVKHTGVPIAPRSGAAELFTHSASARSIGKVYPSPTSVDVRRSTDVHRSTNATSHPVPHHARGRVRVDELETAPMAKAQPPQEGARPHSSLEE